jgi:hypothetical protein
MATMSVFGCGDQNLIAGQNGFTKNQTYLTIGKKLKSWVKKPWQTSTIQVTFNTPVKKMCKLTL